MSCKICESVGVCLEAFVAFVKSDRRPRITSSLVIWSVNSGYQYLFYVGGRRGSDKAYLALSFSLMAVFMSSRNLAKSGGGDPAAGLTVE